MAQSGVLGTLLPGTDIRFALLMIHGETMLNVAPDWLGRLVALGGRGVCKALRLSKAEQRQYDAIRTAAYDGNALLETAFEHGAETAIQAHLIQSALAEAPPDAAILPILAAAAREVFPVTAADLMPAAQGPALGARLAQLRAAWIASAFTMSKDELVALPPV